MLMAEPHRDGAAGRREPLTTGTLINGRYRVLRALGHGGQGWVYDVADALQPERAVALKVASGLARKPALLSLFEVEFRTMTRLDHPNIAQVYDFEPRRGTDDFLITMERIDGHPIHEVLAPHGDWRAVLPYVVQVCRALSYVHSRAIIHYDLKPQNILVGSGSQVKVVDFGIAGGPVSAAERFSGTPAYVAPELLLGRQQVDQRSDLYSLGITLYQLLFGTVPSPTGNIYQIVAWLAEGGLRPHGLSGIPDWLARLVGKLCAINPADRFRSANAVIAALNEEGGFDFPLETDETRASYIATPRFSGRQEELDRVLQFVGDRLSGRGGVCTLLFVRGPSGIGKSRLMKEVRQTAQLQQRVFVESNCYENDRDDYAPVAAALYQLVPTVELMGGGDVVAAALPALVRMAPDLGLGRSYTPLPPAANAEGERVRLLSMTGDFFVRAARIVPFVVYVNDMQWASRGMTELFAYLARRASDDEASGEPAPYALIGSYRSDEIEGRPLAEVVAALHSLGAAADVTLDRLRPSDLAIVVGSMLGIDDVPATFIERLATNTAGNPFFVHEVMRVLLENGSVYLEDGRWATRGAMDALDVPASMADIFRRRLSQLSPEERRLVQILAVHGRPLEHDRVLDAADDADRALAMNRLLALEQRSIVVKEGGSAPAWNLAHDHMRETIYADLPEVERRDLHGRLGRVLDQATLALPEDRRPLDDIARHYREGGDARSVDYAVLAGTRALAAFANDSALTHLCFALSVVAGTDARYGVVLEGAADALARAGRFAEALAQYHRLLDRQPGSADRGRVHGKVADLHFQAGRLAAAEDAAWQGLEALGERRPRNRLDWTRAVFAALAVFALSRLGLRPRRVREHADILCLVYSRLGWIYSHTDNRRGFAVSLFNWRAVSPAPDPAARAVAIGTLGVYLGVVGRLRLGRALLEEARVHAEESGAALALGHVYSWLGILMRYDGPCDIALHERSRAEYERVGDLYGVNVSAHHIAWSLYQRGMVDRAAREATQRRQQVLRFGDSPSAGTALCMEGVLRTQQMLASDDEIESLFQRAEKMALAIYGTTGPLQFLYFRARSRLLRGRVQDAVSDLEQAFALREQTRNILNYAFDVCVALPYAYLQLPALTAAQERLLGRAHHMAMRMTRRLHRNLRPGALLNEALIRERRGQAAAADRYYAQSIAVARAQEALLSASLALYEWGRARQRRGDRAAAEASLREAREIAIAGGNRRLTRLCEATLAVELHHEPGV